MYGGKFDETMISQNQLYHKHDKIMVIKKEHNNNRSINVSNRCHANFVLQELHNSMKTSDSCMCYFIKN